MPHWPRSSGPPNCHARIDSGWPRPTMRGSASATPCSASLCISGGGLISLLYGMKPETMTLADTGSGNLRAAMASAPALRSSASASRRAAASRRSDVFNSSMFEVALIGRLGAEPRRPVEHRSRVPYTSRWAPCDRAHEPGQGQLPKRSIRPRELAPDAPGSIRSGNVMGRSDWRYAGCGRLAYQRPPRLKSRRMISRITAPIVALMMAEMMPKPR